MPTVDHAAIHAQFNKCQAELERLAHLLVPTKGNSEDRVRAQLRLLDATQHDYYLLNEE